MKYDENELYQDVEVASDASPDMMLRQIRMLMGDLQHLRSQICTYEAQVRSARIDTMLRLAKAAEFKEINTGARVQRIGHIAFLIAKSIGLKSDYCDQMFYAAQMHDIGKIGVPDAILKKKGALTALEWESMRQHPEIGAALLTASGSEACELFVMAEEIALTHHEKFDGTGYPKGISGDQIPISGRIVAVADFFDAFTTVRNYRPAFSREGALAELYAQTGRAFDPVVVNAFTEAYAEIVATCDQISASSESHDSQYSVAITV